MKLGLQPILSSLAADILPRHACAGAQLLRDAGGQGLCSAPLWQRAELEAPGALAAEYARECATLRRGVDGDLTKVMRA